MKTHILHFALLVGMFFTPFSIATAQNDIPIIGADESLSQYICVTIPGVKTFGVRVIQSNGVSSITSVNSAKSKIDKQINGVTKKILAASDLLASATSKKAREKLKSKIKTLRNQRETLRYIKTKLLQCAKAELEFGPPSHPILLTNTITHPSFTEQINLFMYGFKFTIPPGYKRDDYCVAVNGASVTPPGYGGVLYYGSEQPAYVLGGCRVFGMFGEQCINGMQSDELMVVITQGEIVERDGDCTSPSKCSLNNLEKFLSSFYSEALLTSFRPGDC